MKGSFSSGNLEALEIEVEDLTMGAISFLERETITHLQTLFEGFTVSNYFRSV